MTVASVIDNYGKLVKHFQEREQQYHAATTGFVATYEAFVGDLEADWTVGRPAEKVLEGQRNATRSLFRRTNLRNALAPALGQLGKEINAPNAGAPNSINSVFRKIYDHFVDNNLSFKSREQTYATPSAGGSNQGSGSVFRLTLDEQGFPMEGWWADAYRLECTRAGSLQTADDERATFKLHGTDPSPFGRDDMLDREGVGTLSESIESIHSGISAGFVQNPSFSSFNGTHDTAFAASAEETAVPGWVLDTSENYKPNTSIYYRKDPNSTTQASLVYTTNGTIYQQLTVRNRRQNFLDLDTPYLIGIPIYRGTGADGTYTLRLADGLSGGISNSVDVTTISEGAWGILWLVATPGANNWARNLDPGKNLTLSGTLASNTAGEVHVDEVIFAPFTHVGGVNGVRGRGAMGQWIAVVGGENGDATSTTPAPWKVGDYYTWTDQDDATRGKNQYWTVAAGFGYLPSRADSTQLTASGGRTFTYADADPDTITLSSGDLVSDGFYSGMRIVSAGTGSNNGTFESATITATVITLAAGEELANEGALDATATLQAISSIADQ